LGAHIAAQMPERVIFEAGHPDNDDDDYNHDPIAARIKRGKQLITIGLVSIGLSILMILIFILLVAGILPSSSCKHCKEANCSGKSEV